MSDIVSSSANASGTSSARGTGLTTSGKLRFRLSRRGILFSIATLIFVVSTIISYTQDPRPDPLTPVNTLDWFRFPLEYNAIRRLPVITGNIRAVFAVKNSKHVWAVGDRGLILHSSDRGKSWEQQQIGPPKFAGNSLNSVEWITSAWAQAQKPLGEQLKGNETLEVDPKTQQNPTQQKPIVPDSPSGLAVDGSASGEKPSTGLGKFPIEFKDTAKSSQLPRKTPQKKTLPTKSPEKSSSGTESQPTSDRLADLYALFFVDQLTGWVVGDGGTILHTTDGGKIWNPQPSKLRSALHSVTFVDAKTGWVVGDGGTILYTTDSGKIWNPQPSKLRSALHSVTFADAKTGWAVGGSFIFYTNKGGETWIAQVSESEHAVRSIAFADAKTGWAVGNLGTILHTIDGGKTWVRQDSKSLEDLGAVTFISRDAGWIVGQEGLILYTTNGGESWNRKLTNASYLLLGITFANAKTGWVAGARGTILGTADGGETWNPQVGRPHDNSIAHVDSKSTRGLDDAGAIRNISDGDQTGTSAHYRRHLAPWYYVSCFLALIILVPAFRKPPPRESPVPSIETAMAADRPLRSGELDVLNLGQIAFALSRFLRNESTQPPLTIAITGDWGTGKSSLMNLLRDDLAAYGVRPIWFNAWHHQKEEHLLASLLNTIREQAIPPFLTLNGLKFRAKLVWGRLRRYPLSSIVLGVIFFISLGYLLWEFPNRPSALWHFLSNLMTNQDTWSFDSLVKALLGGSAALAPLYGVYKILQPFGISPAVLLQNMSQGFTRRAAAQKTGFREEFARDFKEVSEALNPRTMLILIDDLDRCRPDAVLEVMEGINFLVNSGDCFVVMGMAREKIERAIGLSFKEIAKELVGEEFREAKPEEKEEHERRQRWEYGKRYLEKLVNLWVQVPELTPASGSTLLGQATTRNNGTRSIWSFVKDILLTSVSVFVIGALFYLGATKLPELQVLLNPSDVTKTNPAVQSPERSAGSLRPDSKPPPIPTTPRPEENFESIFVPGEQDAPGVWWGIIGLLVLVAAGSAIVLVRPQIVVPDSKNFIDALDIWDDVITGVHMTPRMLKRFMNNLRWLAARTRKNRPAPTLSIRMRQAWQDFVGNRPVEEPGEISEPVLVGLAALEALGFKSAPGDIRLFILGNQVQTNGTAMEAYEKHGAISKSNGSFGNWPPTPEQTQFFFELLGNTSATVNAPTKNGKIEAVN